MAFQAADAFMADVANNRLPQVSWIVSPAEQSEHPSYLPAAGAQYIYDRLEALARNRVVWSNTVGFLNYDENDGFFDHVVPPTAPPGTPGEYLSTPLPPAAHGIAGPIGLGYRVPMIVISPWSRGGWVSSQVFDHTSTLRFLEARFGVREPNISAGGGEPAATSPPPCACATRTRSSRRCPIQRPCWLPSWRRWRRCLRRRRPQSRSCRTRIPGDDRTPARRLNSRPDRRTERTDTRGELPCEDTNPKALHALNHLPTVGWPPDNRRPGDWYLEPWLSDFPSPKPPP